MANNSQYSKLESEPAQNDEQDEGRGTTRRSTRQLCGWFRLSCEVVLVIAIVALGLKVIAAGSEAPRGRNNPLTSCKHPVIR